MSALDDGQKDRIRSIYNTLRGYYLDAPKFSDSNRGRLEGSSLLINYNKLVDELSSISGNDYNRFKVFPSKREYKLPQMDKPRVKEFTEELAYR